MSWHLKHEFESQIDTKWYTNADGSLTGFVFRFYFFPFFFTVFYDFGCAEEVNKRSLVGGVVIEDCLV